MTKKEQQDVDEENAIKKQRNAKPFVSQISNELAANSTSRSAAYSAKVKDNRIVKKPIHERLHGQ